MKILVFRYKSICEPDVIDSFKKLGVDVIEVWSEYGNNLKEGVESVAKILQEQVCMFVFSINFHSFLADVCKILNVKYVSWVVDSPLPALFFPQVKYPNNKVFIFDRKQWERVKDLNPGNIIYLPLGTNQKQNETVTSSITDLERNLFTCEVSFVGSLYTEKCPYDVLNALPEYEKAYLDAIVDAQTKIYGYNFCEEMITDRILDALPKCIPTYEVAPELKEYEKYLLAHIYLGAKVTVKERIQLLRALSECYNVTLYTYGKTDYLPKVNNQGVVSSNRHQKVVFHLSKINLNITTKPIMSGLSLRVWDVMGSGGFLMSNYQEEIEDYFVIGEDLEVFSSEEELVDKVGFYLKHDDIREKIARNGYEKVRKYHSYDERIKQMISYLL